MVGLKSIQTCAQELISRVSALLLRPSQELARLAATPETLKELLVGWIVPLTAIMVVGHAVHGLVFGIPANFGQRYPPEFLSLPFMMLPLWIEALVMPFASGLVINLIGRLFGAENNFGQATRLAAYASTPGWVANIVGPGWQLEVLNFIPPPSLTLFIGALWGAYLYVRGLPIFMKPAPGKALLFTAAVLVALAALWTVAFLTTYGVVDTFMGHYIEATEFGRDPS